MIRRLLERYCSIQQLRRLSIAITVIGALTVAIGWMMDGESVIMLAGLLVFWAGLMKLIALLAWDRLVKDDTDLHKPSIQR